MIFKLTIIRIIPVNEKKIIYLCNILPPRNYLIYIFFDKFLQRVYCKASLDLWLQRQQTIDFIFRSLKHFIWFDFMTVIFKKKHQCFFFVYLGFLSRTFTNHRTAGEGGISLTPPYHFHPLHRHLDISRAITAESSPLHIASSRTQTGNSCFPRASR